MSQSRLHHSAEAFVVHGGTGVLVVIGVSVHVDNRDAWIRIVK